MNLQDFVIEVTRRCNLKCDHCLRGKAKNIDIPKEYIRSMLEQIETISSITFTGGEPSLNTEAILYCLEICKEFDISVNSFYIVTNGQNISEQFVIACLKWYSYCWEKDMCQVCISTDIYHKQTENTLLEGLSFFETRGIGSLINEGYAKKNKIGVRDEKENEITFNEDGIEEGTIYLNCLGEIINGCDWSYKSQKNHVLCNVEQFSEWIENQKEAELT